MAAEPNLSGKARLGYVVVGFSIAAWGAFGAEAAWARAISFFIGGGLIVEGLIGFCVGCWLVGRGNKPG